MKIAILFNDNDFGNTFFGVLRTLKSAFEHNESLPNDKEKLCFLINRLSPIHYILFQNQYVYNGLQNPGKTEENSHFIDISSYLQIEPKDILLNEEVDEYLKKINWNNSETFILDTDLYNNNIYAI